MALIRFDKRWFSLGVGALVCLPLALQACSSDDSNGNPAGAGTGGTGGAGGSATGGTKPSTGGGGAGTTGGSTTTAGTTSTAGTGGSGGSGGGENPACATPLYEHVFEFAGDTDTSFTMWKLAMNSSPSTLATDTVVEADPLDGSPAPASLKLSVPFSGPGEQLLLAHNPTTINLMDATVTAQVKLDSGLNASLPLNAASAFLVLKSGAGYIYAEGPRVPFVESEGWTTLTIDANMPGAMVPFGYSPCDIREITVVIATGEAGTYEPGVIHIDTIAVTRAGSGEGGAGGGAAGGAAGGGGEEVGGAGGGDAVPVGGAAGAAGGNN